MPKIKGPINFSGNVEELLKGKTKVKLPFKAKGFKSSKMPDGVDLSDIETEEGEPKTEDNKDFKKELDALPGVGKKTAEDILAIAETKEELKKVPKQTLMDELRDDVAEVLYDYLNK